MEIDVISGKGGTGKSSVSASLATLSKRMVLADCDVDAANMYLIFSPFIKEEIKYSGSRKANIDQNKCNNCGVCVEYCRFEAINVVEGKIDISELLCDGCELCSRICPLGAITLNDSQNSRLIIGDYRNGKIVYGQLAPGEETSGRLINLVRERAEKLAATNRIDTIIVDGPPGIGCPMISTITGADHVIMVTEPSKSALIDLIRTMQVVSASGIDHSVIINKCDLNDEMTIQIQEYCLSQNVPIVAKLSYDVSVVEAMVECKSMIEFAPDSVFAKQIFRAFNLITNGKQKRIHPVIHR